MFWFATLNGARANTNEHDCVDRHEAQNTGREHRHGRDTIRAAFKANEAFQKRMGDSGVKDHVPT